MTFVYALIQSTNNVKTLCYYVFIITLIGKFDPITSQPTGDDVDIPVAGKIKLVKC